MACESALYRVWNWTRWRGRGTLDVEGDAGRQREYIRSCGFWRRRLAPLGHGPDVYWRRRPRFLLAGNKVVFLVYPHEQGRHGFPGERPVGALAAPYPPEQILQSVAVLDNISVYMVDCTDGRCQLCRACWRDKTRQWKGCELVYECTGARAYGCKSVRVRKCKCECTGV